MDEDKEKTAIEENEMIKALAGDRPVYTYPVNLERSLGRTDHFRDQYDAHCFVSDPTHITSEVEEVIQKAFREPVAAVV